mmetsp:Transcript_12424/g.31301  ORF Transcript_12424/g.31301 Transcript_12424/m.31301 type:complete len:242 (+) Transcript_12424:700-1425(+)
MVVCICPKLDSSGTASMSLSHPLAKSKSMSPSSPSAAFGCPPRLLAADRLGLNFRGAAPCPALAAPASAAAPDCSCWGGGCLAAARSSAACAAPSSSPAKLTRRPWLHCRASSGAAPAGALQAAPSCWSASSRSRAALGTKPSTAPACAIRCAGLEACASLDRQSTNPAAESRDTSSAAFSTIPGAMISSFCTRAPPARWPAAWICGGETPSCGACTCVPARSARPCSASASSSASHSGLQ